MKNRDSESPIHILWIPTVLALGLAYILSFIDLLPDTIVGIGWLDDLAVVIALIWFFNSWLPKNRHRIYWFRPRTKAGADGPKEEARSRASNGRRSDFDPFEVLSVRRGASPDEIKSAYRNMLSKYHPDKVSHLGEEFRQMAHDKVIEITKAYEILNGKG